MMNYRMAKMVVTLVSVNADGNPFMQVVETNSLLGAVRIIISAKAKKGCKLVKYVIEEDARLL